VELPLPLGANMAYREFTDSRGTSWRVWSTVPEGRTVLNSDFERGWLTFDSGSELRRLAPIPAAWEEAPVARLELMCRAATKPARQSGETARQDAAAEENRADES
jgi:hypothetical protein